MKEQNDSERLHVGILVELVLMAARVAELGEDAPVSRTSSENDENYDNETFEDAESVAAQQERIAELEAELSTLRQEHHETALSAIADRLAAIEAKLDKIMAKLGI